MLLKFVVYPFYCRVSNFVLVVFVSFDDVSGVDRPELAAIHRINLEKVLNFYFSVFIAPTS
jgi:hypothetical protein